MKKICRTIKLRKFKTTVDEKSINKFDNHMYMVCFDDNKWHMVWDKYDLRKLLEKDHIRPIRYIFDLNDGITIDRNVSINTDEV